jgi:hypothetical protein
MSAAPVDIDAPVGSYLVHSGPVTQPGVTFGQVQDVLASIASITAAPLVISVARNIRLTVSAP